MPFAKLGFSVGVLKILSYLFVMGALYLFLFKTDFSLLIKIITAFSPLFICYLVIPARSYSLAEFLLVFLMVIYKEKINKPILCGILLALLLQTLTIYAGFVFACSVVWLIDALISYRANAIDKESFLRNGIGMTIVFFSALFLLWEFRYVGYAVDTLSGNSSSFKIGSVIFHVFDMANGVFNGYYIFASLFVIFVLLYTTYRDIRFLKSVAIIVVGIGWQAYIYSLVYDDYVKLLSGILIIIFALGIYNTEQKWDIRLVEDENKNFRLLPMVGIFVVVLFSLSNGSELVLNELNPNCVFSQSNKMAEAINLLPENAAIVVTSAEYNSSVVAQVDKEHIIYNPFNGSVASYVDRSPNYSENMELSDFINTISVMFPESDEVYCIVNTGDNCCGVQLLNETVNDGYDSFIKVYEPEVGSTDGREDFYLLKITL